MQSKSSSTCDPRGAANFASQCALPKRIAPKCNPSPIPNPISSDTHAHPESSDGGALLNALSKIALHCKFSLCRCLNRKVSWFQSECN